MEIISNLVVGFSVSLTTINILYAFVGVLLGTVIGVLPGIGPVATIAMLLPLTYHMSDMTTALIMLAGIYYGAQYGGSTTAILVNLPGETSSVVTTYDGYQMAKNGQAGPALAVAAIASFFAGTIATLLIAIAAPPLAQLAFFFGPAEYFSLIVLGLLAAVVISRGSFIISIGMVLIGILISMIGTDVNTGVERFVFGIPDLADGIPFTAVAIGLFGISEIILNLEKNVTSKQTEIISHWMPSREQSKRSIAPMIRGTMLGSFLGVLPGGGAILSSFTSYALEKKISKTPKRFGKGAIEGVAGPEAANNAGAQTSFIPMLTLGIPTNAVMALMIGGMMIHGVYPGPHIVSENSTLFWGLITSMWIGNLMLVVLNLPLITLWTKLLMIPYRMLYPAIILFCCIGAYSINNNIFDVYMILPFTVIGYIFRKLDCDVAPLLFGLVLGGPLEEYLRRTLIISGGDWSVFITRPISSILLLISVVLVTFAISNMFRRKV